MRGGKQTRGEATSRDTLLEAEANERITAWLAAVDLVLPGEYIAIADFDTIPEQARADSYFWCDQCFTPKASPHRAASDVAHSFHIARKGTFDLLRHEYSAGDLGLIVTESRSFILVQVARASTDILKLPRRHQGDELRRMASQIFRVKGKTRCFCFKLPHKLGDGSMISTNAGTDPWFLSCWTNRIEAGVRCGVLFFLFYKKISQMAQLVGFPNAEQWFDNDFRSSLEPSHHQRLVRSIQVGNANRTEGPERADPAFM